MRNIERKKEYAHKYFQEHKEELLIKHKEYMRTHPEQRQKHILRGLLLRRINPEVAERARESSRRWRKNNPDKVKSIHKVSIEKITVETLTYYGKGKLACVWCGFDDRRALSIDHINNDGNIHRKRATSNIRGGGINIYSWLRKRDYPPGYQTLCMNCQFIKKAEHLKGLLDKLKKGVGKNE